MSCKVQGCDRNARSKGMCKMHYDRFTRYGRTETVIKPKGYVKVVCAVEGCTKQSETKAGVCVMHYKRWQRNGTLDRVLAEPGERPCDFCGVITNLSKGLCNACYVRQHKKGYVERDKNPHGTGTYTKDGYHLLTVDGKRVLAHRFIAGAKPGEVVHHKDEEPGHNEDHNLQKFPSQSDHMKEHWRLWRERKNG